MPISEISLTLKMNVDTRLTGTRAAPEPVSPVTTKFFAAASMRRSEPDTPNIYAAAEHPGRIVVRPLNLNFAL